jgi:hypothetical protein
MTGLDLHLDLSQVDRTETGRVRAALLDAVAALDEQARPGGEGSEVEGKPA